MKPLTPLPEPARSTTHPERSQRLRDLFLGPLLKDIVQSDAEVLKRMKREPVGVTTHMHHCHSFECFELVRGDVPFDRSPMQLQDSLLA